MSKRTTMSDLRDHLFETIERLKLSNDPEADDKEKISLETAQIIANVGAVIVNSAKLEVDAMKIMANCQNMSIANKIMEGSCVLSLNEAGK